MKVWSFATVHETFCETSICKLVSLWFHSLVTLRSNLNMIFFFFFLVGSDTSVSHITIYLSLILTLIKWGLRLCVPSLRVKKWDFCQYPVQNELRIVRQWHELICIYSSWCSANLTLNVCMGYMAMTLLVVFQHAAAFLTSLLVELVDFYWPTPSTPFMHTWDVLTFVGYCMYSYTNGEVSNSIWRVSSQNALYPFWSIWESCWNIKKIIRKFVILLIITSKIFLYIKWAMYH